MTTLAGGPETEATAPDDEAPVAMAENFSSKAEVLTGEAYSGVPDEPLERRRFGIGEASLSLESPAGDIFTALSDFPGLPEAREELLAKSGENKE